MVKRIGTAALAAALLAVAGCGEERGAGGVTAEEARQLNEAADMLDVEDASPDSLTASDEEALGNGEAPSAEEGDPEAAEEPAAEGAAANGQ